MSELTIESDGANRDALAGPPFNEINHNGAEGTTQSIRYAATSRVATKNTTREFTLQLERVSRPRFNRVFTPGCWIVFTTYIRGGDSDPCFTTSFWLSFFFFFFCYENSTQDSVIGFSLIFSFVEYIFSISRKGCCTVSFFYGNNNEISSVFVYYLLFFKEFGIFFQSLNSRWRNLRKNFYSAITGVSLC